MLQINDSLKIPPIKGSKVILPELSYLICGCCFKVHNSLGRFRNEKQYADALEKEFQKNKISYAREFSLPESFAGEKARRNIVDFIVEDKIILELKARRIVTKEDYFQVKRYLAAANKDLGILVNFRSEFIYPKRILRGSHL